MPISSIVWNLQRFACAHVYALSGIVEMPFTVDLDRELPLPDTRSWRILWPRSYAWAPIAVRLNPLKRALGKYVSVETFDAAAEYEWHKQGGFPVDPALHGRLGEYTFPKDPHDLRGEIVTAEISGKRTSFAIDFSDYKHVSSVVLDRVTLMFKSSMDPDENRPKINPIGILPYSHRTLAAARFLHHKLPGTRWSGPDVFGRFGTWTDAQAFREQIVIRLQKSHLNFEGGFGKFKPYGSYLQELRNAQMCVEVPGQGPTSYRLQEGMALGVPVIAARPKVKLPTELIENTHYLRIRDDASDVVEVCENALRNTELRESIARSAARYYDLNLSIEATARRILRALDSYSTGGSV